MKQILSTTRNGITHTSMYLYYHY